MKNKYLIMTENGGRFVTCEKREFDLVIEDKILIFKDLSFLEELTKTHPRPHEWTVKNGKVVPASNSVIQARLKNSNVITMPVVKKKKTTTKEKILAGVVILAIIASSIYFFDRYDITIYIKDTHELHSR